MADEPTMAEPSPRSNEEDPSHAAADPPLLTLLAELHNEIYRLTLLSDDHITVCASMKKIEPAILATCKQVRSEALPLYYAENSFTLLISNTYNRVNRWAKLKSLGMGKCSLMRSIHVRCTEPISRTSSIMSAYRGIRHCGDMGHKAAAIAAMGPWIRQSVEKRYILGIGVGRLRWSFEAVEYLLRPSDPPEEW